MVLPQRQNWTMFVLRFIGRISKERIWRHLMGRTENCLFYEIEDFVVSREMQRNTSQICFVAGFVHDCEICLCPFGETGCKLAAYKAIIE